MAEETKCAVRELMEKTGIRPAQLRMRRAEEVEYPEIDRFFVVNGLEDDGETDVPTEIVCYYVIRDDAGKLAAAACLARREGRYIIDGISVDPAFRRKRLGTMLVKKLAEVTAEKGGKALYLVAREPEFFRAYGFQTISPDEAPVFYECAHCSQYQVSCKPEVMKYTVR